MKIAVFGAGSIGMYVGGALLATGADVGLIGRRRMRERIAHDGLLLTDLSGRRMSLAAADVPFVEQASALADAGLILVTVKVPIPPLQRAPSQITPSLMRWC